MEHIEILNTLLDPIEKQILIELKECLTKYLEKRSYKVILFGSKARGTAEQYSDLDVAILIDGLDRKLKREVFDIVADIELKFLHSISALVLSTEEFNRLVNRERRLATDILREGIEV